MAKDGKDRTTIHINNQPYHVSKPTMTGAEMKTLAAGPPDSWLILNVKAPDAVAGGDDRQIQDAEVVELRSGMHFRIVNPATFGA